MAENVIQITIKAVDEASNTFKVILDQGVRVAEELKKRLGSFITDDQAQQIGQVLAKATAASGKNLGEATQQAVQLLAGLSSQIKETGTAIEANTPIEQRATALLEAFGVKVEANTAALAKSGDEAVKAAADQDKLADSLSKTNKELDAQGGKFADTSKLTPVGTGLLPNPPNLGDNAVPKADAVIKLGEVSKDTAQAEKDLTKEAVELGQQLRLSGKDLDGFVKVYADAVRVVEQSGQSLGFTGKSLSTFIDAGKQAIVADFKKAAPPQLLLPPPFVGPIGPGPFVGPVRPSYLTPPTPLPAFVGPPAPPPLVGPVFPSNITRAPTPPAFVGPPAPPAFVGPPPPPPPPPVPPTVAASYSGLALAITGVNQALELMEKVFGPITHALEEVSQDAGRFEQQVVGLESTLKGFAKTASAESLIEFSDEMRKTSGISRELVIDIEQTLLKFTDLGQGADVAGEQVKELTALVIALSKTENLPVSTLARQVSNFLTNPGSTSIGRGLTLPNVDLDERRELLLKRFGPNIQIAREQLDTFIGSQQKLAAAAEQVGHIIGERMNEPIKAMNEVLAEGVESVGEFLKQHELLAGGLAVSGNAIRGTLTVLEKLAPILSAIALISMSPLVATLGTLGAALTAFAITPPGLVLIGAALLAIGGAAVFAGVKIGQAAEAAKSTGEKVAAVSKSIESLEKQRDEAAKRGAPPNSWLEGQIARLKAERKALEDAFGKEKEGADTGHEAPPQDADSADSLRAQSIAKLTKEVQEAAKDQAQALIAAQTEVKAEGEKLLFESTQDISHLLASISLGRLAITQKADAEINAALRAKAKSEFGGEGDIEKLRREAPDAVKAITDPIRNRAANELAKYNQANIQTERQAREAAAKANIDLIGSIATAQQAVLDNDQAQLQILKDLNAPLEQQLDLLKSIAVQQNNIAELNIKKARQGIADLQARPDAGTAANLAQQEALTAEIQKQNTLKLQVPANTLKSADAALSAAAKRVTDELQAQLTIQESQASSDQRRIDLLNNEAQAEGKQRAPVAQLLELAADLDKLEEKILQKKVAQAQFERDQVKTRFDSKLATQEELDAADARLKATQQLAENVSTNVLKTTQALKQEALAAADQLSTTLADSIITGLEDGLKGGKKGILKFLDDLVISAGKTFLTQGLTEALKSVTVPLLESQQKEGERLPTTLPGIIFGIAKAGSKDLLGLNEKPPENVFKNFPAATTPAAGQDFSKFSFSSLKDFEKDTTAQARATAVATSDRQLAIAAEASKTAADFLKQAAVDLSNAAAKLSGSPSAGATTTARTGAAPTSASPPSNAPTTLTAEQLGDLIEQQIGQRNEIQRQVPQNPQEAAQQAEQLRVANSQLQSLIELRSAVVGAIGKPQTVKLEEPRIAEQDITFKPSGVQSVRIESAPVLETNANITSVAPEAVPPQQKQAEPTQSDALEPVAGALVQSAGTSAQALTGSASKLEQSAGSIDAAADRLDAPDNVQLGPTTATGQIGDLTDAIENLGGDKSLSASNVSSLSLPSTVNATVGGASTSSVGDASFSSLQGILGTASGLAGGQNAAAFGKVGGAIGAAKNVFDLYGLLDKAGLFGGGSSAGIFGQFPAASGLGAGADLSGYSFSALGGAGAESGGLFSSIGSGVSTAIDFITSLFSLAHEGGPIDKYRRLHTGGPADDVPIMAQHGEYMLQRSAAASIGRSELDRINATGKLARFHTGGMVSTDLLQHFSSGGPVSGLSFPGISGVPSGAGGMVAPKAAMAKLGGSGRDASIKPGEETRTQSRAGINAGREDVAPAPIHQNIYVVDQRPKSLSPNDVIAAIENDMVAGNGRTARAVQNVIKRTR